MPFRKIKNWSQENELGQIYSNAGVLLVGNGLKYVFGIASLAIAVRVLGVRDFGFLVLVQSYVVVCDRLFNFQSWQALIKYGAGLANATEADLQKLKKLIKFGSLLDFGSAFFAAISSSVFIYYYSSWRGWSEELRVVAVLFSLSIIFRLSGTPTAILRIFNRYRDFAISAFFSSLLKLILSLIGLYQGYSLFYFGIVWLVVEIIESLMILFYGWRALWLRKINGVLKANLAGIKAEFQGIWKFLINSNLEVSARLATREADIFIVSSLLSLSAVTYYKTIKELVLVLTGIADAKYSSAYPVLAKLFAEGNITTIKSYLRKTSLVGLAMSVVVIFGYCLIGKWFLVTVFGSGFDQIFIPLLIALGAVSLWLALYAYSAMMLAIGFANKLLLISILTGVLSLGLQVFLTPQFGLTGAALSFAFGYILWGFSIFSIITRYLRLAKEGQ
jgi:O-antigen/teichoic acid export membrane protein